MPRRPALFVLVAGVASAPLSAACGGGDPAVTEGGGSSGAPVPTSGPTGAPNDAGDGGGDALCAMEAREAGTAMEIRTAGEQPPPLGGTIAPGTYVLSEAYVWVAPIVDGGEDVARQQVTGKIFSKQLRLTAAHAKIIGAEGTETDGLGADRLTAGTYTTRETSLVLTPTCATGPAETYGYTASSAGIVLYDGDRQEIFTLVP